MPDKWQKCRNEFNHDWLKNEYLKAINAFIKRLDQHKPDRKRIQEFLRIDLQDWTIRRNDVQYLLDEAENVLSPQNLFNHLPLSQCSAEVKEWLPSLIHEYWLWRNSIKQKISRVRLAKNNVDTMYDLVIGNIGSDIEQTDIVCLKDSKEVFRKFAEALRTLSNAICEFPHKIRVF